MDADPSLSNEHVPADADPLTEHAGTVSPEESTGVALSGGGVRAALFSLGVLIGIIDMGEHRKVTNVASVSGGSIINAAIAQSRPLSACDTTDEFQAIAKPLAESLCRRGAFVFSGSALMALARGLRPLLGAFAFIGVIAYSSIAGFTRDREVDLPWGWIIVALASLLVFGLFLSRGALQEAVYSAMLSALPDGRSSAQLKDMRRTSSGDTTHVIVATDLVSGSPVYFARDFVCCPAFGWGRPDKTKTASAVAASAAFPVMFPVRRFRRKQFNFQNGLVPPPFPRKLKLNDGGVYNNLGTDWFDQLEVREMWDHGNLQPPLELDPVSRRIVVNAGAASRGLRQVPPFLAISRTMSVLYDNTVRPRLRTMRERAAEHLDAPVVIDISESPYDVARRHAEVHTSNYVDTEQTIAEERKQRAHDIVDRLGVRSESFWIEFARQTSSTPTKLTRAGLESGARMMFHGYLSTVCVLYILHGIPMPATIKDEGYFLDLAGRRAEPDVQKEPESGVDQPPDTPPVEDDTEHDGVDGQTKTAEQTPDDT